MKRFPWIVVEPVVIRILIRRIIIRIPAPDLDDVGGLAQIGEDGIDVAVSGVAAEVDRVPATLEVVGGGLPLSLHRAGEGESPESE